MPKIICKIHDDNKIITYVKIENENNFIPISQIWERIKQGEEFYTSVNKKAKVYARTKDNGTKYITSHPDGFTPNNLDELKNCY